MTSFREIDVDDPIPTPGLTKSHMDLVLDAAPPSSLEEARDALPWRAFFIALAVRCALALRLAASIFDFVSLLKWYSSPSSWYPRPSSVQLW